MMGKVTLECAALVSGSYAAAGEWVRCGQVAFASTADGWVVGRDGALCPRHAVMWKQMPGRAT